jgi:hypothetical protein
VASPPSNGRRRRQIVAATAVLLSGALAGCGGSSKAAKPNAGDGTATPGVAAVDLPADQPQKAACGLVTQAEVEAAVGARVAAGQPEAQPERSLCLFSLASAADQSVLILSTSSSGVPAAFASTRAGAQAASDVSAGDEAFVNGGQALVRKGTSMVAILVALRQPPAQLTAAATKLAQAVGTRL